MMENNKYIKFMSDIIDSGVWAELSAGAKTLYPVLLKFSDQNFKQVWPSTKTLMKLTGFKTKKSIIEAKKDLINAGLLQVKTGTGHSNSVYYFCFNYKGSKITPLWGKNLPPQGVKMDTSARENFPSEEYRKNNPNQINITITNNNQRNKTVSEKRKKSPRIENETNIQSILLKYGIEVFNEAYLKAKELGMEESLQYLESLCKEKLKYQRETKSNHNSKFSETDWLSFLKWASENLSKTSLNLIKNVRPVFEGNVLLIADELPNFLKEIITKYFTEITHSKVMVIFQEGETEIFRI